MFCIKCKKEIPDGSTFCNWCGARQDRKKTQRKGNGTGSVMKHGDKYLAVVQVYDPTRRTKSKVFEKKKDAVNALAGLRDQLLSETVIKRREPTFINIYEEWHSTKAQKLSDSKQRSYECAWRRIPDRIKNSRIKDVNLSDLQKTIDGLSYYNSRDIKTLLSRIYEIAIAQQDAAANLAKYMELPVLKESESTPFSIEEVEQMWASYESGNGFIGYALLMIYTGMMPGELVLIKKSMVEIENKRIVGAGIKTKERKQRSIVLPDKIVPVVEHLLDRGKKDMLYGRSDTTFRYEYYEAIEKAGVRSLPPYSCRHTTATLLALNETVAPFLITKAMRHATPIVTERYKHAEEDQVREALNSIK